MNKIRFAANKDTNYIFHMLSVAKCGYDNSYGEHYRTGYPQEELNILKQNEPLLTVRGGEHCGLLHGLLVGEPACARMPLPDYYRSLIETGNAVKSGNTPDNVSVEMIPYTDTIIAISEIMLKYYNDYSENIWAYEKAKIENYISDLQDYFEKSDFTEKAEKLVGCCLKSDYFTATLVTSVEGGAEAIDISRDQDVFGIERTLPDAVYFIGHEFIIYLLFEALAGENAFESSETWLMTEGLAEYYLKKIMGNTRFNSGTSEFVEFYERCEKKGDLSAVQLYREALLVHKGKNKKNT